jgi:Ca2+-binding EF-hand superfamily protein
MLSRLGSSRRSNPLFRRLKTRTEIANRPFFGSLHKHITINQRKTNVLTGYSKLTYLDYSQNEFFLVLDLFDRNRDGKLQYDEFLSIVDYLCLSPARADVLQMRFFPTKKEELTLDEGFNVLFMDFFDVNDDNLLQYKEFLNLAESFSLNEPTIEKLAEKFFPTKKESLNEEEFRTLMGEISLLPSSISPTPFVVS